MLRHVIRRIRKHWPRVAILVRGDSHYCSEPALAVLERLGCDYIIGFAINSNFDVANANAIFIDFNMWDLHAVTFEGIMVQGYAWAVSDGFFSIAHFLLAMKYQAIATKIPTKLAGKTEVPET